MFLSKLKKQNLDRPMVTIMMPTFNRAEFISDAIRSVIAQTYKNWELIILIDGSTDNTESIIRQFISDKRIKYLKNKENLGLPKCRNIILNLANGEFVGHLDDDDMLYPNAIKSLMEEFKKDNYLDLVYSDYIMIDKSGKTIGYFPSIDFDIKNLPWLGWRPFCIFKKKKALEVGGYNEFISHCNDGDLFMKIAVLGGCKRVAKYLYIYRSHEKNMGHTKPVCDTCNTKDNCNYFKIWKKSADLLYQTK